MTIAPILLFSSNDFDEFTVANNAKIRKTTREEFITLFAADVTFHNQHLSSFVKHEEHVNIWEPFVYGPLRNEINETQYPYYTLEGNDITDIVNLLFCIRIAGPFDVFCPIGIDGGIESNKCTHTFIGQTGSTRFGKIKENRTIDEAKLKTIKLVFEKLASKNTNQPKICKVIDAFNTTSNHALPKTIRYLIGVGLLESLFVNNKKEELSFKFRLFGAFFLKSAGMSVSLQELKNIYNNRSILAHGQQAEINNSQLNRLIEICQIAIMHEIINDSSETIEHDLLTSLGLF